MLKHRFSYLLLVAAVSFGATACSDDDDDNDDQTSRVTFEDLKVDEEGFWKGDTLGNKVEGMYGTDYNQQFTSGTVKFDNTYTAEYSSWKGFGYSQLADSTVEGTYLNDMYVYGTAGAANSKTFAVAYSDGATITFPSEVDLESVMVNNSTYTYKVIRDGNGYSTAFKDGDWFNVIFTGYDEDGREVGNTQYLLADFRDGKNYICKEWTKVDLSVLKNAKVIKLTFDGTDRGDWGLNTPTYVCIDNLEFAD